MEVGKVYNGFQLNEVKTIGEYAVDGFLFTHKKSGAELIYFKSDDDNKTFTVSFRTPPEDDTGLPHILEHSVLAGSRKFKVKDPFFTMSKTSLNNFLNAMTYPDKTVYPFASRNTKDFFNLLDVYLDAVFYPGIYDNEETLMREGWRYELDKRTDELTINGVVYNEMQGVYSSPEELMYEYSSRALFPDTPYGKDFGGFPEAIPSLTNEQFLNFHRKYYHPSNANIALYGDMDIDAVLKFLDQNYLSAFDKIEVDSAIPLQQGFDTPREIEECYPVSESESEEDKTFLALTYAIGDVLDRELALGLGVLYDVLMGTPASPLKKALLRAGIGKDISGGADSERRQPLFALYAKYANSDQKDLFIKTVDETLQQLVREGIDKKLIEACINKREFRMRECDYSGFPKGLVLGLGSLVSWNYDASPFTPLCYEEALAKIKTGLTGPYFERMIEKYLLNNNHSAFLTLMPKRGLSEEKARKNREKLKKLKEQMTPRELEDIREKQIKLKNRQEAPDSPEALASMPSLKAEDIERKAERIPLEERELGGIKLLFNPLNTNKIAYLRMYFDARGISREHLPYLSLLSMVLTKMDTKKRSYGDLSNEIGINTGGLAFGCESYFDSKDKGGDRFSPKMTFNCRVLLPKLESAVSLFKEIVTETQFFDKKRLLELIREYIAIWDSKIKEGQMTSGRLMSLINPIWQWDEVAGGIDYFKFLVDLEKDFDAKADQLIEKLQEVRSIIFNRKETVMGVTLDQESFDSHRDQLEKMISFLPENEIPKVEFKFVERKKKEGLMIPSDVNYVLKGYNFKKLGHTFNGAFRVSALILTYDHLLEKIRLRGGAYGAGMGVGRSGIVVFNSYRDPNLKNTLNVYDDSVRYLGDLELTQEEITKRIIGVVGKLDRTMTPRQKGGVADSRFFSRISYEDIQQEREEVIDCTQQAIKESVEIIAKVLEENCLCIIGNEAAIKENRKEFDTVENIFT